MEFVRFLKVAYTDGAGFDFDGKFHQHKGVKLAVNPRQRPHPPLWMETRDPPTLAFCAEHGIDTGYFLLFPRRDAAPRYRKFLADWRAKGWARKPRIAYSTVVYVDETDDKALDKALRHAGNAYRGFLPPGLEGAALLAAQAERAKLFEERGEPGAAEVMRHLTDAAWLLENEMIILGSPATVTRQLREHASAGVFNTFFAEFNFGDLAEADLMRSIRLFGEEVLPALRNFEPF
jgi:alkanesulfonate monooxygenase SsuD/methylene tetrahydromethanopterin reductase-like flavin-dependent oxidoreductase (luciferase family)